MPLARQTVGTVVEDSTQRALIVLNGSDSDSKYAAFIITEIPRMGILFSATGEPVQAPFSASEVCWFAVGCNVLHRIPCNSFWCRSWCCSRPCTPRQ